MHCIEKQSKHGKYNNYTVKVPKNSEIIANSQSIWGGKVNAFKNTVDTVSSHRTEKHSRYSKQSPY